MNNPLSQQPTIELCREVVTLRVKTRRLDKDPQTRSTMLAAATSVRLREVEAELATRDDFAGAQRELNTTREDVLVEPGQIWRDRDKRTFGRLVKILAVEHGIATVQSPSGGTRTKISVTRMRPISTGFDLVSRGSA